MSILTSEQIIRLSEEGARASHPEIGHALLCAAFPQSPPEELRLLTLGQRNAVLLRLREINFGPTLACVAECAACRGLIEAPVAIADLLGEGVGTAVAPEQELEAGGIAVRFRPVNGQDAMAIRACRDAQTAGSVLAERCVLSAHRGSALMAPAELPAGLVARMGAVLARSDPQSQLSFRHTCPECGCAGESVFDPVSFLWREIRSQARRILEDVRHLERAYGWPAADILKMSAARRRIYMESAV